MDIIISLSINYLNTQRELLQGEEDINPTFIIKGRPRYLVFLDRDRIYIKTYDGNFPNHIICYFIYSIPIRIGECSCDFILTVTQIFDIEPIPWRSIPYQRWEYANLCSNCSNRNMNNIPNNDFYCDACNSPLIRSRTPISIL